jgi:hypothetical protein
MFLMMMIACFASGALAILLAFAGGRTFLLYSIPGFVIGAFFAFKYFTFDKSRARQEEHRRKRNKH